MEGEPQGQAVCIVPRKKTHPCLPCPLSVKTEVRSTDLNLYVDIHSVGSPEVRPQEPVDVRRPAGPRQL